MGGPIFLETSTPRERPQSLIEAISQIQQYATVELYGAHVPEQSLLLTNQGTFIWTGFKGGAGGMALSIVLLPLSLAVLDMIVPVFGGGPKTVVADLYDRAWSFLMTFFWPLGYWALFVTQLAPVCYGRAPMRAIGWLVSGWVAGVAVKIVLGVLAYHLALFLLPPERVADWLFGDGMVRVLLAPWADMDRRLGWLAAYTRFYPLWITSSLWLIGTGVGLTVTLALALAWGHRRARRRARFNELYEVLG
jgi:hypothetical protein